MAKTNKRKTFRVYPTGYTIEIQGIEEKQKTYCDKKGRMYVGDGRRNPNTREH